MTQDPHIRDDLPAPLRWAHAADRAIATGEGGLIVLLLSTMIVLAFMQVLLRNVFDSGIPGSDEFTRAEVLWVAFVGASLATRHKRHVGIDILSLLLPRRFKRLHEALLSLVGVVVCGIFVYAVTAFLVENPPASTTWADRGPWMARFMVPLGFTLMTLRFALNCVTDLFDFAMGRAPAETLPQDLMGTPDAGTPSPQGDD